MKVKICGLTRPEDAGYLNEAQADYAGFVFYEKSRRCLTMERAGQIFRQLSPSVVKTAVTVSPGVSLAHRLEEAGFDILQVHRELSMALLKEISIPVWYAFNISDPEEFSRKKAFFEELPKELSQKITGIVVDAAQFGGGKTFDWERTGNRIRQENPRIFADRLFILAGGLNAENVRQGISLFHPDVVDVSSGVEKNQLKDRKLILDFIERAKADE